jgi:hypothetical protein
MTTTFTLPLWFPCVQGSFKVQDAALIIGPDGSRCAPLFQSEAAGKAFIQGHGGDCDFLWRLQLPLEFFGLLVLLQEKGLANVIIDPVSTATVPTSKFTAIPVRELRATVKAVLV